MKKIFLPLLVITMASCGNNSSAPVEKNATAATTNENEEDFSNVTIFKSTDCSTCHRRTENFAGPSFTAIATRYPNAPDTTIDHLAATIINGSSGKWEGATAEMTPHPSLSKALATQMVKYILQVKK